jgi:hypothetical protein
LELLTAWKSVFRPERRDLDSKILKTIETSALWNNDWLHIEEISQFPPGYVDMRAFMNPGLTHVSCTGDPLQNPWTAGRKFSALTEMVPEIEYLQPYWSDYCLDSYRISRNIAHFTGLVANNDRTTRVTLVHDLRPNMFTITARTLMADSTNAMLARAVTFNSCTGLDLNEPIQIVLDKPALTLVSTEACFTALTRTTRDIFLVHLGRRDADVYEHRFWGPLLRGERLDWRLFAHPPNRVFSRVAHLRWHGADRTGRDKLALLPAEFHRLWEYEDEMVETDEVDSSDAVAQEPNAATHLPSITHITAERFCEARLPKDEMEYAWGSSQSNRIRELVGDPTVAHIFAKEDARDETHLPSAVKKRMRFRDLRSNLAHAESRRWVGALMLGNMFEQMGISRQPIPLDEALLQRCDNDVLEKKLTRPFAQLLANLSRVDPDEQENYARIFAKSQIKSKRSTILTAPADNRPRWWEADDIPIVKPGQTIALFPDEVLRKLGGVTRYVSAKMKELLPPDVLFFGGLSPADLDAWCQKHARSGKTFTNDFTAYDQSCTGEALWLEIYLLRHLGFGEQVISYYWWLKTDCDTTFGHSAIMRFTGEPGTYIFNTIFNLAYLCSKYEMRSCPWILSGDDSLGFGVPAGREGWHLLEPILTLVGKTVISDLPECCGWLCYPEGVVRDPLTLALKLLYRRNIGDLAKVLDNYFLEALFGYTKADKLFDFLDPELIEYQSWVINYGFSHSRLVPHLSRLDRTSLTSFVADLLAKQPDQKHRGKVASLFSSFSYIVRLFQSNTPNDGTERSVLHDTRGSVFVSGGEDPSREEVGSRCAQAKRPRGHNLVSGDGECGLGGRHPGGCGGRIGGRDGLLHGSGARNGDGPDEPRPSVQRAGSSYCGHLEGSAARLFRTYALVHPLLQGGGRGQRGQPNGGPSPRCATEGGRAPWWRVLAFWA